MTDQRRKESIYADIESPSIYDHGTLNEEYRFYNAVREGDLEYVRRNCAEGAFAKQEGKGILSTNPLTNMKYHYCITTAILARHCIAGGMEMEQAYRLSDLYISKLDSCFDVSAVVEWHDKMVLDFAGKMHLKKLHLADSGSVQSALDYIYKHITEPLSLKDIADSVALSSCYLSRLFMKETGLSIKDYILEMKVEKAQNLLKYSDSSSAEIAQYLSFSSQSHFIATFKRFTGLTPKKYKDQFTRRMW